MGYDAFGLPAEQYAIQTGQQKLVFVFTGNELAFVEPRTIIQQKLDVARKDGTGMCINRMVQFFFYMLQQTSHCGSLSPGEV